MAGGGFGRVPATCRRGTPHLTWSVRRSGSSPMTSIEGACGWGCATAGFAEALVAQREQRLGVGPFPKVTPPVGPSELPTIVILHIHRVVGGAVVTVTVAAVVTVGAVDAGVTVAAVGAVGVVVAGVTVGRVTGMVAGGADAVGGIVPAAAAAAGVAVVVGWVSNRARRNRSALSGDCSPTAKGRPVEAVLGWAPTRGWLTSQEDVVAAHQIADDVVYLVPATDRVIRDVIGVAMLAHLMLVGRRVLSAQREVDELRIKLGDLGETLVALFSEGDQR
jgi:hypothetical protein